MMLLPPVKTNNGAAGNVPPLTFTAYLGGMFATFVLVCCFRTVLLPYNLPENGKGEKVKTE